MTTTSCIVRIIEEIKKQTNYDWDLPYTEELKILLNVLKPNEKILLGNYFLTLEWNIGSTNMLSILQKCNILTATQYILVQTEYEHIQLVLNDFLEAKFELLANIVTRCYYDLINSVKLSTLLEECFRRLFRDLFENPKALTANYIDELKQLVQDEVILMVQQMHITVLLSEHKSTVKNAISDLHMWRQYITKDTFLHTLLIEITGDETQLLQHILKKSLEPDFKGWKFYTILLEMISRNCTEANGSVIKKHIKDLFKQFLQQKNQQYFYMMLITARTVHSLEKHQFLDTYSHWFKITIGDMNYVINPSEFKLAMATLMEIVKFESECTFLEIQTNTSISAPPLCNQIVLKYKNLCRQRIASIKGETERSSQMLFFDPDGSIVIDDD